MVRKYIPDRGDIIWINFNPHKGREQKGKRPALVLSPKSYNEKARLVLVCPITSHTKGYPFEISFNGKNIAGTILTDQIRALDWSKRSVSFADKASKQIVKDVQQRIILLLTG